MPNATSNISLGLRRLGLFGTIEYIQSTIWIFLILAKIYVNDIEDMA